MIPEDNLTWDTPYEKLPNVHPHGTGTNAKALQLARENNIPLLQIVAMSSYNTAAPPRKTGLKAMQERGRMQEGMVADITIFDPETVTDNATYKQGTIPSTSIPYVIELPSAWNPFLFMPMMDQNRRFRGRSHFPEGPADRQVDDGGGGGWSMSVGLGIARCVHA